jgi:hypothetical protein
MTAPIEYSLILANDTAFKVARNSIDYIPIISGNFPTISGISSLDNDFDLIFSTDQILDSSTLTLKFSIINHKLI